jgi:hypothetical protein
MNWYYALGDQRQGPVSDADLDALIAAGTVTEITLVWRDGMLNWAPLKEARPAAAADVPAGWIRCTATGRYFPPEEIVYLDGKPYSGAAKPGVLQEVLQTGVLPSSEIGRTGPPWENRKELGFFPAIAQTVKGVLLEPSATFSAMKREGGLASPLLYEVMMSWAGIIVAAIYGTLFQGLIQSMMPRSQAQMPFNPMALNATIYGLMIVLWPVIAVIVTCIAAGVFHLSLMLCQGARQPFETTFRTYCYSWGSARPLQFIPVCGGLATFIWAIVAMCIGIAKTHEITTGRAVLAVLLPIGVCCMALILFYGVLVAFIVSAANAGHH